jgi:GWxTD domain-containing protein
MMVVPAVLYSCKSTTGSINPEKWNLSALYNPAISELHPSYKVYHNTAETSLLYVKIFTNEILFQPTGGQGVYKSDVSINYTLYLADEQAGSIADSGTYSYSIFKNSTGPFYLTQVPMKTEMGKSYRLKLIMRDKLRNTMNVAFMEVEKRPELGQQFFNVLSADGKPLFKNVLMGTSAVKISYANPSTDSLYISFYKNETPLPKPTFAAGSDDFVYGKPDSVYVIKYSPDQAMVLPYCGMYFIQFDTTKQEGVSITRFENDFPKVTTPEDLLNPLAYITNSAEYSDLLASKNKKLAADNFWIKSGGSTSRGREMIRIYYNRVYFANYYFTNTKPGWKTDRGMVYIVYGSPHYLKKTADSEIWYYYRRNEAGDDISFKFDYQPNKYNLNQYQLERSENNTWHWREAVYSWTNGEIFLQN